MAHAPPAAPSLRRRLACMLYEGVLLFGVLTLAGWLFALLVQQRHALQHKHALQAVLFVVLAAYFVGFWTRAGQTLAMKTWRIRVERADGAPLSPGRAFVRYLAAWLWFLPALLAVWLAQWHAPGRIGAALTVGVLAWASAARLHPRRQFWHDALAGTRLVEVAADPAKHNPPR
jgi:uncharacterized RDD family membrane protein YckC